MNKEQKKDVVKAAREVVEAFANTAQESLDSKQCDALERLENALYPSLITKEQS